MARSLAFATAHAIVLDPPLPAYRPIERSLLRMNAPTRGGRLELTPDEVQLLRLLATEMPMDAVARSLKTSERTLRRRSRSLFDKIGVAGRIEAAVWASRNGLL